MTRSPRRLSMAALLPLLLGCSGLQSTYAVRELPIRRGTFEGHEMRYLEPLDVDGPLVQLHARRSYMAEGIAVHPWFVAFDADERRWESYEVWGLRPVSYESHRGEIEFRTAMHERARLEWSHERIGVVDRDTGGPHAHVPRIRTVLAEWTGDDARTILEVLQRPRDYPYADRYRAWPGPNSNTYVAWVLREAGIPVDHHPLAIGKDYLGPLGFGLWFTTTFTGLQVETPIVGAKAGLLDGVELHLLTMTIGVDLWPPAIKTPLGRFGFPE